MPYTETHPLVDQGGAERRGDGHRGDDTRRRVIHMTGMASRDEVVRVEIWSDVVCPWCYIGKRRFERAVAELDGEIDVDAVYRPFQLDPTASPGASMPVAEAYARKFGGPEQAKAVIDRVTAMAHEAGIEEPGDAVGSSSNGR